MLTQMDCILPLYLCAFLRHYRNLVEAGHIYIAMLTIFRIDAGKKVFYALDESERQIVLDKLEKENFKGKVTVTGLKA